MNGRYKNCAIKKDNNSWLKETYHTYVYRLNNPTTKKIF